LVILERPNSSQITLIRSHLQKEQKLFSKADFRDPKKPHVREMPGHEVLAGSEAKYDVKYNELPKGVSFTFASEDSTVIMPYTGGSIHN